jgi:hypothetical protein
MRNAFCAPFCLLDAAVRYYGYCQWQRYLAQKVRAVWFGSPVYIGPAIRIAGVAGIVAAALFQTASVL